MVGSAIISRYRGGICRAFMEARRDQAGLQLPSCSTMDRLAPAPAVAPGYVCGANE